MFGENVYLCRNITYMKGLQIYDYEKAKEDYINSYEIILPPNNDGSRPNYTFPIKHQVLRCGKWVPEPYMLFNAIVLYYRLVNNELQEHYITTQRFGFTPIKTHPTNMRHFFSKDDQCACDINAIIKNRTTMKCNYID